MSSSDPVGSGGSISSSPVPVFPPVPVLLPPLFPPVPLLPPCEGFVGEVVGVGEGDVPEAPLELLPPELLPLELLPLELLLPELPLLELLPPDPHDCLPFHTPFVT